MDAIFETDQKIGIAPAGKIVTIRRTLRKLGTIFGALLHWARPGRRHRDTGVTTYAPKLIQNHHCYVRLGVVVVTAPDLRSKRSLVRLPTATFFWQLPGQIVQAHVAVVLGGWKRNL